MKTYGILLFGLLLFATGCGQDGPCDEELPSLDQYISDNNLTVEEGEEGLRYIIIDPGEAERPSPTATVTANYIGTTTNDAVFDETNPNGSQPIAFPLTGVIRGWQLGLQLVGRGGRIQLFIPASIGYGSRQVGSICPNSDLVFEVELVNFVE